MSGAASQHPDASEVSVRLARAIDRLAPELLPAGKRKGGYWTCGSIDNEPGGSLFIHLVGSKAGKWADAATGEFGDALDLVAGAMFRGDKKRAYWWSLSWLGLAASGPVARRPAQDAGARPATVDQEDDRRRRAALRLFLEARPSIAGTPADLYLAGRGIAIAALGRQPRSLRFHPACWNTERRGPLPALIAAISGATGHHVATHRTWLAEFPGGWGKARLAEPKMSLGVFAGGSIRLWRGASRKPLRDASPDEVVVIAEGIETALSIAIACPELRVLAAVSLGNMGSVWLPPQVTRIILCADNDLKPKAQRAFQRVVERHLDAHRDVRVARAAVGKDFNDTLQAFA